MAGRDEKEIIFHIIGKPSPYAKSVVARRRITRPLRRRPGTVPIKNPESPPGRVVFKFDIDDHSSRMEIGSGARSTGQDGRAARGTFCEDLLGGVGLRAGEREDADKFGSDMHLDDEGLQPRAHLGLPSDSFAPRTLWRPRIYA